MYSAWLRTGGFQYSRNIATPRIVASLPYFPHANAYIRDHRARTFPCDFTKYQLRWAINDRQSWQLYSNVICFFFFPLLYLFFMKEDGTVSSSISYWIIDIVILRSNFNMRNRVHFILRRSLLLWEETSTESPTISFALKWKYRSCLPYIHESPGSVRINSINAAST